MVGWMDERLHTKMEVLIEGQINERVDRIIRYKTDGWIYLCMYCMYG